LTGKTVDAIVVEDRLTPGGPSMDDGAAQTEDHPARFVPRGGESWRDPYPMYRALREHAPIHHVEDGDYWVLSRFADVFAAARDTDTYSSAEGLTFTYGERAKVGLDAASPIVMMDPPEHTAFRRLVAKGFTPRQVTSIEDDVRAFVVERLERLRAAGAGDVVASLFKPLPSFVVAHYLGVDAVDRHRFDGWTEAIVAANAAGSALDAGDAIAELLGYFSELAGRRRTEPGDDAVSALLAAGLGDDEGSLLQVLGFAFTMVAGGNDTTTGLLGGAADLLTRHPDQRRRLIDAPDLIPQAVDELLRLTSPVQGLARTTTREVELYGTTIPAGKKVMLLYASANRDQREFGATADQLDVTRSIPRMMSFGYGAHHCLGAAAARLQARVTLEELLARCPDFVVDGDAGRFAPGAFVRRFESLPFSATGLAG
jgi:cytochrome P450 family 130